MSALLSLQRWSAHSWQIVASAALIGVVLPLSVSASPALQQAVQGTLALAATEAAGPDIPADRSTVSVYIGTDIDTLLVQSARLTLGDEAQTRIDLGGRGARALLDGGMLRLQLQHPTPVPVPTRAADSNAADVRPSSPLMVEVIARRADGAMSAMRVRLLYEAAYLPGVDPADLQLLLTRDGVLRRYVLQRVPGDAT